MIPRISEITLPLLKSLKDGQVYNVTKLEKPLATVFDLSEGQIQKEKASGDERLFLHRIRWARTMLHKAGLVTNPKVGHTQITQTGLNVLDDKPDVITESYLSKFKKYRDTRRNIK